MNKSYKNINANDFDSRARTGIVARKAAYLVPKLLEKMIKAVIHPVTKLVTGNSYEEVKKQAVGITMQEQLQEASELGVKIEEGYENLEDWEDDTTYFIGNMAEYKAYRSTIERLEKRQLKLMTVPKILRVAKNYLSVMKEKMRRKKEQKQVRKMVQEIVKDYQEKKATVKAKELEVLALEDALRTARMELSEAVEELNEIKTNNPDIVNQIEAEIAPEELSVEPETVENIEAPEAEVAPVEAAQTVETPVVAGTPIKVVPRVKSSANVEAPVVNEVVTPVAQPQPEAPVEANPFGYTPQMQMEGFGNSTVEDLSSTEMPVPAPYVENEPLFNQMAALAGMEQMPAVTPATLEAFGLSDEGKQR